MADPTFMVLFSAQSLKDPASASAIEEAQRSIGRTLPRDYCAFLAVSDGYDDMVGKGPLTLWPAGQLAPRNEMVGASRRIADLALIGSNGSGTLYGIDWASGTPQFVSLPFASMERAEVRMLAATFEDFLRLVASGEAQ